MFQGKCLTLVVLAAAASTAVAGRIDLPARLDGQLVLVGTEIKPGEMAPEQDKVSLSWPFLVVQIADQGSPDYVRPTVPESEWLYLIPTADSRFLEAVGQAQLGDQWKAHTQNKALKVYRRWHEGDPLRPHQVEVAFEQKEFRKLHEGDAVLAFQLLAWVDPTVRVNDVAFKIAKLETAESEYIEAGKTKQEAERRAKESQRLYELHTGIISLDAYYADVLNSKRYAEEERGKDAARKVAVQELSASLTLLRLHEIRSPDAGVVQAILKHRGEAVRDLEPVIRLEVGDASAAPPGPVIHVPAQRDGVLLVLGREIKEGEKVPADRVVAVTIDGEEKRYLRLREGDTVEEGQLLARLDDRLARLDVELQKNRVDAAEAALNTAAKVRQETAGREQVLDKRAAAGQAAEEDVRAAKVDLARAEGDERVKAAALHEAQTQLKAAEAVREMYEIRSPVRGFVKFVAKNRGEAVKALETVVEIEERAKE